MSTRREPPDYEAELVLQMHADGLPEPVREHRFHPRRRWRFDFAWPALRVALEVEGATWAGGRHTRGKGYESDCEKYSEAAILGWTVIRATGKMALMKDGRAIDLVKRALQARQPGQAA
jgi:very-short-patch-repair endonuclease